MLDTSTSMVEELKERYRNAKKALNIIFDTFNQYDHISMVSFSNSSKILGKYDHVTHAYQSTRDSILNDLSKIEVDTGTNYSAGFE